MHSNPIRSSALAYLALASIYILSPYIPICSLASCFIYYTHINIASMPVLTSPYVPIYSLASCFIYYTHIDIASIPVLTLQLAHPPSHSLIAIGEFK